MNIVLFNLVVDSIIIASLVIVLLLFVRFGLWLLDDIVKRYKKLMKRK